MKPAMRAFFLLASCLASGSLFCRQAEAAVVTYTNRAAWSGAVVNSTVDNFSDLSGTTLGSTLTRPGYTVSSTTVLGVGTELRTGNTPAVATRPFLTANTFAATTFTLNFATPRTAFGVDAFVTSLNLFTGVRNIASGNVTVTVDGVPLTQLTNGPTFFGFLSETPFTQVTITKTGLLNVLSIENVTLATAVPEPSAVATAGLIAAGALVAARRRRAARRTASKGAAAVQA